MSDKIKQLEARADSRTQYLLAAMCNETGRKSYSVTDSETTEVFNRTFAELILQEVTDHLMEESERLYALASEETNVRNANDFEICAEKCIDLIAGLEEKFK